MREGEEETFSIGDTVSWKDYECEEFTEEDQEHLMLLKASCGYGPFKVADTINVPVGEKSQTRHSQFVDISHMNGSPVRPMGTSICRFSGFWFVKISSAKVN